MEITPSFINCLSETEKEDPQKTIVSLIESLAKFAKPPEKYESGVKNTLLVRGIVYDDNSESYRSFHNWLYEVLRFRRNSMFFFTGVADKILKEKGVLTTDPVENTLQVSNVLRLSRIQVRIDSKNFKNLNWRYQYTIENDSWKATWQEDRHIESPEMSESTDEYLLFCYKMLKSLQALASISGLV